MGHVIPAAGVRFCMPLPALQRNTMIGMVASVLLAAGKFAAGVLGNSSALVADAVESLADTVGSVVVWQGLRVASRPPNDRHPYGYGRAEALATLCVGVMLWAAAIVIVVKATKEMLTPHAAPAAWTLAVLVVVVTVKEALFRFVLRGADRFGSEAARADAWHHRSDAITSGAAFVGVLIAIVGPGLSGEPNLVLADEVAAIIAAGVILITGWRLMRPALAELLDVTAPGIADAARSTAATVEGVRLVEKTHARKSGSGYYIDMHLHVAPGMRVDEAHALSGKVKAQIREAHPAVRQVLIHIEPDGPASEGEFEAT